MNEKMKSVLSLLVPYGFICAGCWHFGYWSTFDVNPFEYMGVDDILKSFFYPFIASTLGVIVSSFLVQVAIDLIFEIFKFEPKQRAPYKVIDHRGFFPRAAGVIIIAVVWYTIAIADTRNNPIWLAFVCAIIATIILVQSSFFWGLFGEKRILSYAFAFAIIPAFAFMISKRKSEIVKENLRYEYAIDKEISLDTLKNLGKIGNYFILSDLLNTTKYIVPIDKKPFLVFYEYNIANERAKLLKEKQSKQVISVDTGVKLPETFRYKTK